MSTAQDLPVPEGDRWSGPTLRLVTPAPLDFDGAVRRLRPRLHRFAVRRLGDRHEAEELVQEALLRAYTHRAQLRTEDDLAAWATVVTGRLVIDRLRVRGRSTPVADVPEPSRLGRDTADVVVARDEARLALDSLDAMPSRQAALLWAREVEGHSYEVLCARFSMSEPAVRSVLTRARKALRKEYAARGGTLPVGGLAVLAPWLAGLTWADKLRRATGRLSAPAALSAVAITALGGLLLSPFGISGGPGQSTFSPTRAVVTSTTDGTLVAHERPVVGLPATPATSQAAPERGGPGSITHRLIRSTPCLQGGTTSPRRSRLNDPGLPGNPVAGPATCAASAGTPGSTIYLDQPLPTNPTGVTYLGVTSDKVTCTQVPNNPLAKCVSDPAQQGATP